MILVLLVVALSFFIVNFFALVFNWTRVEYICKPAVILILMLLAFYLHGSFLATGLVFFALLAHLAGDVLLMLPQDMLLVAIALFLVGHVFYILRFIFTSLHPNWLYAFLALVGVLIFAALILPSVLKSLQKTKPELVVPVIIYAGILSILLTTAAYSANLWAILGAVLFIASEAVFAQYRFMHKLPLILRPLNISLYHFGQALLVLSLLH